MTNQKNILVSIKNFDIVPYKPEYAKNFYDLNVAWLKKYFYVEAYDEMILSNPEKYILNKGGFIFFAKLDHKVVGVVSIINQKTFFELSKMAVSPKYRGLKIGQQLVEFCINFANEQQWKNIILYSHRTLVPAINLYKKMGFIEIPLEKDVHYERADIKMILKI